MPFKHNQKDRLQKIVGADSDNHSTSVSNRREFSRRQVRLIATVMVTNSPGGDPESISICGLVLNLSRNGAMIATPTPLEIGSLSLRFLDPVSRQHVIESRVVHSSFRHHDHPFVYGVEFQRELTDTELNALSHDLRIRSDQ